jgi:hypothetical protein
MALYMVIAFGPSEVHVPAGSIAHMGGRNIGHYKHRYWSERSECADRVTLQMGCKPNVVATKFIHRVLIFCMQNYFDPTR